MSISPSSQNNPHTHKHQKEQKTRQKKRRNNNKQNKHTKHKRTEDTQQRHVFCVCCVSSVDQNCCVFVCIVLWCFCCRHHPKPAQTPKTSTNQYRQKTKAHKTNTQQTPVFVVFLFKCGWFICFVVVMFVFSFMCIILWCFFSSIIILNNPHTQAPNTFHTKIPETTTNNNKQTKDKQTENTQRTPVFVVFLFKCGWCICFVVVVMFVFLSCVFFCVFLPPSSQTTPTHKHQTKIIKKYQKTTTNNTNKQTNKKQANREHITKTFFCVFSVVPFCCFSLFVWIILWCFLFHHHPKQPHHTNTNNKPTKNKQQQHINQTRKQKPNKPRTHDEPACFCSVCSCVAFDLSPPPTQHK